MPRSPFLNIDGPVASSIQTQQQEAFENFMTRSSTIIVVGVLCILAMGLIKAN